MELTPYIMYNGNCEEALNFYAKAMDGEIKFISRYGDMPGDNKMGIDKNKVMHATFEAGAVKIMASDSNTPADTAGGGAVNLSLNIDDANQLEKVFNGLAQGGSVTMPLQDTFWGARFGMLTDKFGIKWMLNHELRK